jgi:hypothetical protein
MHIPALPANTRQLLRPGSKVHQEVAAGRRAAASRWAHNTHSGVAGTCDAGYRVTAQSGGYARAP